MTRGQLLVQKRREKGLTRSDLAKIFDVSEEKVARWEAGELPDSEYLLRLADVLGISVEDILREDAETSPEESAQAASSEACKEALEVQAASSEDAAPGVPTDDAGNDAPVGRTVRRGGADAPSGANGYSPLERKVGYAILAIFAVFFLVAAAVKIAGYVTRPRELTEENYREYLEIEIVPETSYNPEAYIVRVTALADISDLSLTLSLVFPIIALNEEVTRTVSFSGDLSEGEQREEQVALPGISLGARWESFSVSGGLR